MMLSKPYCRADLLQQPVAFADEVLAFLGHVPGQPDDLADEVGDHLQRAGPVLQVDSG